MWYSAMNKSCGDGEIPQEHNSTMHQKNMQYKLLI